MRKKTLLLISILGMCLLLNSCVYWKVTVIKIRGGNVKAPIGSYTPIAGEDIKGTIIRQVWLTDEKGREAPNLKGFVLKEKGEGENTEDEIDVKK